MGSTQTWSLQGRVNRNLLFATVGDRSLHSCWFENQGQRTFDVMLVYYGDRHPYAFGSADYTLHRKGFKFPILASVLKERPDVFSHYDRIWMPDDDIQSDLATIEKMFRIFAENQFELAQPAIGKGEVSYKSLLHVPGNSIRYSPYVEVMCPLFSRSAFALATPLFGQSQSGWGIDWVWSKWMPEGKIAIIDETPVHHTGTLMRGELYQKLKDRGIDPPAEFDRVTHLHGGIDRKVHRKMVKGKLRMKKVPIEKNEPAWWHRFVSSAERAS